MDSYRISPIHPDGMFRRDGTTRVRAVAGLRRRAVVSRPLGGWARRHLRAALPACPPDTWRGWDNQESPSVKAGRSGDHAEEHLWYQWLRQAIILDMHWLQVPARADALRVLLPASCGGKPTSARQTAEKDAAL